MITLAANCREFRCLPGPGSLMEQDGFLIFLVNIVQEAWREKEDKEAREQKAEAERNRNRS